MNLLQRWVLSLYGLAMWLARPMLRRKLARRALAEPGYAHAVPARFGWPPAVTHAASAAGAAPVVWVHAVSLGETRAAAGLVAALRQRLPGMRLLLTHSTATGWAEGQRLLQPGDVQTWLPWDDPWSVRRFLRTQAPAVGLLMETEIWPTLIHQAARAGVPMALVNARLNESSMRGALRLRWLSRPAYAALAAVWAQTSADAQRLLTVGARAPQVLGNLKFDARPDAAQQALAASWKQVLHHPVVMLASSREGEEAEFLKEILASPLVNNDLNAIENIVFLVVPRHPQRFDEVARLLQSAGRPVWRRAQWGQWLSEKLAQRARAEAASARPGCGPAAPAAQADADALTGDGVTIWLGDSLGEMALYASLADVALLGGSFEPLGGQNLIELAACGCPVVAGPHTFNFAHATEDALAHGAAQRVPDMATAVSVASRWLAEPARHHVAQAAARQWAQSQQGAVARTVDAVATLCQAGSSASAPTSTSP